MIGLYAIVRLSLVQEAGEVKESVVVEELMLETWRTIRNLSTVGGLRAITVFPFALLLRLLPGGRRAAAREPTAAD